MNDDQMRGCVRASETIRAYEATFEGEHLLFALRSECAHALRVSDIPAYHDEWSARAKMYRAAIRRIQEEVSRAA